MQLVVGEIPLIDPLSSSLRWTSQNRDPAAVHFIALAMWWKSVALLCLARSEISGCLGESSGGF